MSKLILIKDKFDSLLFDLGMDQLEYSGIVKVNTETISRAKKTGCLFRTAKRIISLDGKNLQVKDFFVPRVDFFKNTKKRQVGVIL